MIELDPAVTHDRRFRSENPDRRPDRPCVYVGSTSHSAEHRFEQHRSHPTLNTSWVQRFGRRLIPELGKELPGADRAAAERAEARLARRLRNRGHGVWQR